MPPGKMFPYHYIKSELRDTASIPHATCLSVVGKGSLGRLDKSFVRIQEAEIFFEKFARQRKNAIRDKKRGKNIDRVMEVPENDTRREKHGSKQANVADSLIAPKNESHKEREAGVPGKKIISPHRESLEKIKRIQIGMFLNQSQMREHNEKSASRDEQRGTFDRERDSLRLQKKQEKNEQTKQRRALIDDKINVHYRQIIQEKIGDGITGAFGRVDAREVIEHDADYQKQQPKRNGVEKIRFHPIVFVPSNGAAHSLKIYDCE